MIEKEERKIITVINDWIQNIHIYGHACQSDKNGNMNFAEYNDLNRHGGRHLRCVPTVGIGITRTSIDTSSQDRILSNIDACINVYQPSKFHVVSLSFSRALLIRIFCCERLIVFFFTYQRLYQNGVQGSKSNPYPPAVQTYPVRNRLLLNLQSVGEGRDNFLCLY
jgi:hypothetical protein